MYASATFAFSHARTIWRSQDECTRMHTNAYAYTTAFTVHYDAFWMHSTAFTYIIRHRSASACTRASMQRPHKGVDAHGCAEVRGSVQDCTKNARGEMHENATECTKKATKCTKTRCAKPPPNLRKTPPYSGYAVMQFMQLCSL